MTDAYSLSHHLLVAMPGMSDPRFDRSVIYLCEHSAEGAFGLVINKPIDLGCADVLRHLGTLDKKTPRTALSQSVLDGGPVKQERGYVLHSSGSAWQATIDLTDEVSLTHSQDILQSIGRGEGPDQFLIAFGCSRWQPGQLEREVSDNVWLTVPATSAILFDCPYDERWVSAATMIGLDFNRLTYVAGHA